MPLISRRASQYLNVKDVGAIGDGVIDDTAAIQAAADTAYAMSGATVFFPEGRYILTDKVAFWGGTSLCGVGRKSVLVGTGTSNNSDRQISISSGVPASIYGGEQTLLDPAYPDAASVIDRTAIGALEVGEFSLTLSDVSGMSVGQLCYLWLGVTISDITGPYHPMWNVVKSIVGSVVTFNDPLPEAILDPDLAVHHVTGVPTPRKHHCWISPHIAENIEVANLSFERDADSGNIAYHALGIHHARNVHVHDIYGKDLGYSTVMLTYGTNVILENIYGDRSVYSPGNAAGGGFIGGWAMRNFTIRNVEARDINGIAIGFELQMRNVLIEQVRCSSSQTNAAFPIFINMLAENTKQVIVRNAEFQSIATDWVAIAGYEPDVLENITIHKNCSLATLANARGMISYEGVTVRHRKSWSTTFSIPTTASSTAIPLPSGWYRTIRIYLSTVTGLLSTTNLLGNVSGGGDIGAQLIDSGDGGITEILTAEGGAAFMGLSRGGAPGFNNNAAGDYQKTLTITVDGTTPVGHYGRIEIDYFPLGVGVGSPAGPPGVNDLSKVAIQGDLRLRGQLSINLASIDAVTIAVHDIPFVPALLGDSVVLNPPAAGLTAGLLLLQSYVSANEQITMVLYNTTGAPINEAAATWTYQLTR